MLYINKTASRYIQYGPKKYDLHNLTEDQVKELLLIGCFHIAISDAGLKKPLFTAKEIVPLVTNAATADEASRFACLSSAATVKTAWQKRMERP